MKKQRCGKTLLKWTTLLLCAAVCLGLFAPSSAFAATGSGYSYASFDANGGSGWMSSIYLEDEVWTVPDSEFTNPFGYAFSGWGLNASGPVVYRPGDVAYNDGDTTLYALWHKMTAEELAELYTPQNVRINSWNLSAAVDEQTGVVYMTAKIGWSQIQNVENFTVGLNLGAPDGPRVPCTSANLSTLDGSVTTSWSTSYGTVAVPFLADGVQQQVTDGAVNGVVDGDVVFATVCSNIGGTLCPGKPVYFTCDMPYIEASTDETEWFVTSGSGTVERESYSATITLTKDTTLPSGGISLSNKTYHLVLGGHTLTGTLINGWGEVFVEHPNGDGTLLSAYAMGEQTLSFNGFGCGASPVGSVESTLNMSYSQFAYDPSLTRATVTNGEITTDYPLTLASVNNWGYANQQEPVTLEMAGLSEAELAAHAPKNLAVTLEKDGVVVEWDADSLANEADVSVDVIMADGTTAHLSGAYNQTTVAPGFGPSRYAWSSARKKNIFRSKMPPLELNDDQPVNNGYVEGVKPGQKLRISVTNVLGGKSSKYQTTPASTMDVVYNQANFGKTFKVNGEVLSKKYLPGAAQVSWKNSKPHVYNGEAQTPAYTVEYEGQELTKGVDYAEKFVDNVNAGTAQLIVTGVGDCSGELTAEFTIEGISVTDPGVTMQLGYTETAYNGKAQSPAVLLTSGNYILQEGTDYSLAYANNTNAGEATVTATGMGNFSGERTEGFTITARSMASENVKATLSGNRFAATGEAIQPGVAVKWALTDLSEGTDYTLSYVNNTKAGTAAAVLTGIGNYTDARNVEFTIYDPVSLAVSAEIDPIAPVIYTRSAQTPAVTVRVGEKVLTEGWDYTVAYSNNVAAGTGTVTVTGRRDYYDEATAFFVIDPADLATAEMTLSKSEWSSTEPVYDYSGGENKPYATLTFNGTTLYEGTSFTLSYENNVEAGTATAIATGMGNFAGTKRAEFTVSKCDLNDISASIETVVYSGEAQTPRFALHTTYLDKDDYSQYRYLAEGADFTVDSWANNTNAGEASVTLTGAGNFTGTRTLPFTIKPMPIYDNDFSFAVESPLVYTGQELEPQVTVTWKKNGSALTRGTDFTVEYYNNTDVGTAEARVLGMGNFESSTNLSFSIVSDTSLPPYGVYRIDNGDSWILTEDGTLTVDCSGGSMSSHDYNKAWRPYGAFVKKIVIENATSISAEAFSECVNATEMTIPATVTRIAGGGIPYARNLTVHLPDNITEFGGELPDSTTMKVFVKRGSATEASLKPSAESPYRYNFFYYEGYPDFMVYWSVNRPEDGLQLYRYTGSGGTVVIPDFFDYVTGAGFESTYLVTKIVIPGTVSKLGTFQNSSGLREIVIEPGNKLTELRSHFISGCDNITLYLPDNITSIGSPLNYYTYNNMLIVASCDSYAIEWAKGQMSWGMPLWTEEDGSSGAHYRLAHRNPTSHAGKAPTCTEEGWTDYVTCSACEFNSKEILPALGHSWNDPVYTWNDENTEVTATRVCRNDPSHVETEKVAVFRETVPATCVKEGQITYTSAAFENPAFRVQVKKEALPLSGHDWTAKPSTAATDASDGVRGGVVCAVCGAGRQPDRTVSSGKSLKLPAKMKTIEAEAFCGVAAAQVNIPSGTVSIGSKAFSNCPNLLIAVIPTSVTSIADDAFQGSDAAVICPDGSPAAAWCDAHHIPHNP